MYAMPWGVCELKHAIPEQVFDAESFIMSSFDRAFASNVTGMETTVDARAFDTTHITLADFDAFHKDLLGLFNT